MSAGRVVAMFGLSGVGKGGLAGQVRTVRPDVLHLEASALMRAAMGASGEAPRTAAAGAVQGINRARSRPSRPRGPAVATAPSSSTATA